MVRGFALTFDACNPDITKAVGVTAYDIDFENIRPNQIAVQALAAPVNPSDLFQIMGVYTAPTAQQIGDKTTFVGGNEGVFQIVKAGSDVAGFSQGDWVIPLGKNFGTWRTHALIDFKAGTIPVIKVRDSHNAATKITLAEAATIGVNPPSALQMIQDYVTFAGDNKDWIIQNAGGSQVSKFVTQFARVKKINVISIIRDGKPNFSEIEAELVALGATKVITESQAQSEEYQKTIIPGWAKETGGSVKLALNSVGGASANALLQCLSQDGHLVSYGQMDPAPILYASGYQLFKNFTTQSYWLSRNSDRNPQSKIDITKDILEYYESGQIQNIDFTKNGYEISSESGEKFLGTFVDAIKNSSKDKQVVVFN